MAGVAGHAFRKVCKEFGAAYLVGEMASAKGLVMSGRKTAELLSITEEERPMAVQIFGDEPETVAEAARICMRYCPDIIDINMGCPAHKVAGNGGGSALLKNPALAGRIVRAAAKAVPLPITAKIRIGWDNDNINAAEVAKVLEANGAAAIAVHGRTRAQMYAPPVNIRAISDVKKAVKIPVIANGDITDRLSARKMLDETGADLLMVGRGACGRPWVFAEIRAFLEGREFEGISLEGKFEVMLRHIRLLCEDMGEAHGMREARKHAAWYMRGLRGAAAYRQKIAQLTEFCQLEEIAQEILAVNI
jgi:nifR3 family TIM-barrel protein